MFSLEKPASFNPKFSVVGCFVTCGEEILLLLRQDHKPQGGTWGLPGGKIESNENPDKAVLRELFEETGIQATEQSIKPVKTAYIDHDDYDFIYQMYSLELEKKPNVQIDSSSHKEFIWIKISDVDTLPGIPQLDTCMEVFLAQRG
jgi:8-oxo-dGTP diphosphatase